MIITIVIIIVAIIVVIIIIAIIIATIIISIVIGLRGQALRVLPCLSLLTRGLLHLRDWHTS